MYEHLGRVFGAKIVMMNPVSLVDAVKLEKMVLAKRVGRFLVADQAEEERSAVENVARVLAQDVCNQVREVLAFELRNCRTLARDLAEKIARDIESVSGPFLLETRAFTNEEMAHLVPTLKEHAIKSLAQRPDLPEKVAHAVASYGMEPSVTSLVRNDRIGLSERAAGKVVERFGGNRRLMDHLSARADLPLSIVERIISTVSDHARETLIEHYTLSADLADRVTNHGRVEVLWNKIRESNPAQVHAFVTDLRTSRRLNHLLVVELAERGSAAFMESALALEAGLPIGRIREILTLSDPAAFVRLMQMANVSKTMAPKYLRLAKKYHAETKKIADGDDDMDSASDAETETKKAG